MKVNRVCILGGTGFVGRHLVPRLARDGISCRIISRRPHRHRDLLTAVGSELVEADIFDASSLAGQFQDCDAVVNLIGILNQSRRLSFRRLHVELVDTVVQAARSAGIKRLLHMSALHADSGAGSSQYLRSKGEGENRAHTGGRPAIAVTSFRPSVIFGHDDSFINRFATLLALPGPMPLACPKARFQPVWVSDVVEAFARSMNDRRTFGRHYDLCGPREFTLREVVGYVAEHSGRRKTVIGLSDGLSRLQANLLQWVPGKPFTPDNYLSLKTPSVCKDGNGLLELGITPTDMDAVVPNFLADIQGTGNLDRLRRTG